jgi:endonuclease/exonuclease/phosphatase (EEP) superfamily protein YafD
VALTAPTIPPRHARRRVGRWLAGAVVVGAAVVVQLPDLLGLDRWVPLTAAVAIRAQLAVAVAVPAVLLLGSRRCRPVAGAVLAVCVVAGAVVVPRVVAAPPPPGPGSTMTVLSFNVDQGEANVAALAATIRAVRPDVVVLPEAAERYRALVVRAIPDLGYRSAVGAAPGADDVNGITAFTAPEMGAPTSRVIDQGGFDPWLELSGGRLGATRLVAVHVSAPVPGKIESWRRELAQLRTWCAPASGPAVIVGDLNATLDHREFRAGTAGCQDAGAVTGQGLAATWNAGCPRWFGAQIDHVLTGGGPAPVGLQILDLPGSDHRALLARLRSP